MIVTSDTVSQSFMESLGDKLANVHDQTGKKRFKQAWDKCNFGCCTEVNEKKIVISSKVYGKGVFTSVIDLKGRVTHSFAEFER